MSWGKLFQNPARRVTIIGCGKSKLPGKHRAEALYTGGLFRASLKYAKSTSDVVYIASANYGLLELSDVVESYDLVITELSKTSRELWAQEVVGSLLSKNRWPPFDLTLLLSKEYMSPLSKELASRGISFKEPLKGLDLFERNAWLKAHTP